MLRVVQDGSRSDAGIHDVSPDKLVNLAEDSPLYPLVVTIIPASEALLAVVNGLQ